MNTPRWPVMGREREIADIHASLTGIPGGVLLCGETGVGKTALARHIIDGLGTGVYWAAATESARQIPLGPFAALLRLPPNDPLAALAAAMETIQREKYAVVGVDDVHLADHLSATLLHQLAVERRVGLLMTARSGAPLPEAITALWKDGYIPRLDLAPLAKADMVRAIESALGGRVESLSADLIWQASGGNPFFVRQMTDGALEAGSLRDINGVWQLRGHTPVSPKLAGLLSDRIHGLPDAEKRVLHLLAVAESLPLTELCRLTETAAVEQLERRGLIAITDRDGVLEARFTHTLLGEVVNQGLGSVAHRRLTAEVVGALADRPSPSAAERLQFGRLVLDSGVQVDPGVLLRAAEDALACTNVALAEQLARAAAARGAGLVAGELLARTLVWQGRAAEAEALLSSFDPTVMTEFELARWGIARVAMLQWALGDTAAADAVLAMLRSRVARPGLRLMIDSLESALLVLKGRLDEAVTSATQVAENPDAPPAAIGWAAFAATTATAMMGRTGEVAGWVRRGSRVSDRIDGLLRFLLTLGEVRALTLSGDFAAAEARSGDVVRITCPDQYRARAMASVLAATVELGRGRLGDAADRLKETLASLTDEQAATWSLPARLLLAQAHCGLGQPEAAAPLVAALRSQVNAGMTMFAPAVRLAEAWLAAAEGHLSGAATTAAEAADLALDSGQRAVELMALHAAARFGDHLRLPRLIEVADLIGGPLATADRDHAVGLMNNDGVAVLSAAQDFERIGAWLSAADAAAQAAALFESEGRRRQFVEAAAMADRLAVACGGLRTPALRNAATPLPLSTREREIATLVAHGLTNRDIAERLVVSLRTVEGHLYRIFQKLNVTHRDELAALIRG